MMPAMRWWWLSLFVSSLAFAQAPTPRGLFEEGAALFEQKAFEQAAERFEASFALRPVPVTKFNAARSWERAGKTLKAIAAWQAWLAMSPGAPQRGEAEGALRELGERLAKQGLQALTVTSLPLQARVFVDGVEQGVAPVTVELPLGRHLVRVEQEGREPVERALDFTLAAPRVERFELAALGPKAEVVVVPAPSPLEPTPLPRPEIPRPTDPEFALQLGDDFVHVHLESANREVRLYRVGGNPNGECRVPCDAPVARATDVFFVGGAGVTASRGFVLADHRQRGRVHLKVRAGSAGAAYGLGSLLLTGGALGLGFGVAFAVSGTSRQDQTVPALVSFGAGAVSLITALVVMIANGTSVTFDEPLSPPGSR